jgi:protein-L-isoaspartate(D-aspartate) O-methyltransferase
LREMKERGERDAGGRGPRVGLRAATQLPNLSDLGVTKTQSSRWQALAALPKDQQTAKIAQAKKKAAAALDGATKRLRTEMRAEDEKRVMALAPAISQPFVVALMTDLAAVKPDHTVLEVGTGSGYQAAILARLVRKVCTVEIIPPLAEAAAKVLRDLGYDNVSVKVGDGYHGWPECGPFDATIVTAALEHVPSALIEQLKVGGRLVIPLGPVYAPQQLTVVEKIAPSETRMRSIIPVRFVPFTRSQH